MDIELVYEEVGEGPVARLKRFKHKRTARSTKADPDPHSEKTAPRSLALNPPVFLPRVRRAKACGPAVCIFVERSVELGDAGLRRYLASNGLSCPGRRQKFRCCAEHPTTV